MTFQTAKTRLSTLAIAVAMSACAASPTVSEFQAPDGSSVKTVKCTSDTQKCFAMATQSCPGNGTYRVLSSESHAGGMLMDAMPGPFTWYSMTYTCGPSDGKMPDFKRGGPEYVPPPVVVTPPPQRVAPTTTTCNKIGDQVRCTTY